MGDDYSVDCSVGPLLIEDTIKAVFRRNSITITRLGDYGGFYEEPKSRIVQHSDNPGITHTCEIYAIVNPTSHVSIHECGHYSRAIRDLLNALSKI